MAYTFYMSGADGETATVNIVGRRRFYRRWALSLAVRLWAWAMEGEPHG